MSILIAFCPRDEAGRDWVGQLRRCAEALAPDNILPHQPVVSVADGTAVAVVNPVPGVTVREDGACLGRLYGQSGEWWRMGSEAPEGNYMIVRRSARTLEVLTDIMASRPTWYAHTPDLFIASTSQRALVMLLGSFELDPRAVTWMLTSGHLAGGSWDTRVHRLPGDCRLVLDRRPWNVEIVRRPAVRDELPLSDAEHIERLRQAVLDTYRSMSLPYDRWLLTLSGGLDSRAILLGLIQIGARPRCVTWGRRSALQDPRNDAFIARELARSCGVEHEYWPTDEAPESIEVAMDRFLAMSEGQVSDFGAYTDGMAMWKAFFESGVDGIVRGDEPGMGCTVSDTQQALLREHRQIRVGDYPEGHPIRRLGLIEVEPDPGLRQRPGESLRSWGARLEEEWFYPAALAPLGAIKEGYVELVNPLTSKRVTEVTRQLPDRLYEGRACLEALVSALGSDAPVAAVSALRRGNPFWHDDRGLAGMRRVLECDDAERVFSRRALDVVLAGLARQAAPAATAKRRARDMAKVLVPKRMVHTIRPVWPLRLSGRELAFRAYVAVRMADVLTRDAERLGALSGVR